jgi:zinc transport system permease protein
MDENFFLAIFTNPFLMNALIAIVLSSIASGIMGSFVVVKKISSLAGSISHSILGGIGFFLWLNYKYNFSWADPLYGAFLMAILSAVLIGWVHLKYAQKEDAAIAAIWSTGMGLGVIFMAATPSFGADFSHYLFGNILLVSKTNLILLLCLNMTILLFLIFFYYKFLIICFDEEMAYLQNIRVRALYLLLLILISLSIVLLMQTIGIILVIALLTIPPTIAQLFSKKLYVIMAIAIGLSILFNFTGMALSYDLNLPPGATISILSALGYVLFLFFSKKEYKLLIKKIFFLKKRKRRKCK